MQAVHSLAGRRRIAEKADVVNEGEEPGTGDFITAYRSGAHNCHLLSPLKMAPTA
jgi:hypothetical protein